jgi:hypothetical protein
VIRIVEALIVTAELPWNEEISGESCSSTAPESREQFAAMLQIAGWDISRSALAKIETLLVDAGKNSLVPLRIVV